MAWHVPLGSHILCQTEQAGRNPSLLAKKSNPNNPFKQMDIQTGPLADGFTYLLIQLCSRTSNHKLYKCLTVGSGWDAVHSHSKIIPCSTT